MKPRDDIAPKVLREVRELAEAELSRMEWLETSVNTWLSPDGCHVASFTDFCGSIVEVHVRENA